MIDADDLVRPDHLRALDHIQPDAAETEHDHIRARFDLRRIHDRAHARRHAAADVADLVERRVFTYLRNGDFRHDDVVRERRCTHVVEQRFAVERKTRSGIGHQALALRRTDRLAKIGLTRQAEFALAAFRRVQRNDVVALLQRAHARTDVDDHARAFMAENRREDAFRIRARERVVVGVADARRLHFDQDFTGARALRDRLLRSSTGRQLSMRWLLSFSSMNAPVVP